MEMGKFASENESSPLLIQEEDLEVHQLSFGWPFSIWDEGVLQIFGFLPKPCFSLHFSKFFSTIQVVFLCLLCGSDSGGGLIPKDREAGYKYILVLDLLFGVLVGCVSTGPLFFLHSPEAIQSATSRVPLQTRRKHVLLGRVLFLIVFLTTLVLTLTNGFVFHWPQSIGGRFLFSFLMAFFYGYLSLVLSMFGAVVHCLFFQINQLSMAGSALSSETIFGFVEDHRQVVVRIRKVAKAWEYPLILTLLIVIVVVPSSATFSASISSQSNHDFYLWFGLALGISIIVLAVLGVLSLLNAANDKLKREIFLRESLLENSENGQLNEIFLTQYLSTTIVAWEIILPITSELFASLFAGFIAVAAAFAPFVFNKKDE